MQPTGCLRDPTCASSELQFGGLREGGGTREAGSTVAESLVVLYQVGTHQIRRRRRAARSLTSQGRAEPLCARIESANREVSEGKADLGPRSFFFLRGPHGAANGQDSWGFFKDAQGFVTAGCWLARRLQQLKASTTMDLGISIFLIFVRCVALRNLELLIKLVGTCLSDLLLRTLVVGRRQQSESIEAALDME